MGVFTVVVCDIQNGSELSNKLWQGQDILSKI